MTRAPRMFIGLLALSGLLVGCERPQALAGWVPPQTLYVSATQGDDASDCRGEAAPCRTLQRAIDQLRAGDQLVVGPGTYFERPVLRNLGSSRERPVWIRGEPRGSAVISGMWEDAARGRVSWRSEGDGIYSTPSGARLFGDHRGTFLFRFLSLADLRAHTASTEKGPVTTPPHGFAYERGRIFLRLPEGQDPNGEPVLLSPPSWNDEGPTRTVVQVEGSPSVILDGLTIEGSGTFCVEFDAVSRAPVVRNTVLRHCRYGLRLPDASLVEWTEYTYPGLRDFAEALRARNQGPRRVFDLLKAYQPAWMEGGLADSYGRSGTSRDLEFRFNFMHQTLDGESLGDFEASRSHHNVYRDNYDDHVEMESWAGHGSRDLHLHDSLFLSAGLISHQGSAILGPQYVYRNVWYFLGDAGREMWTVVKSDAPAATAGIFYRHNLLWSHRSELFWQERPRHPLHFHDNLLVFERLRNTDRTPGITADRNVLVNEHDLPWLRGATGRYAGATAAEILGPPGDPLRFERTAALPDGVGPFGTARRLGPDWPRPQRTTFDDDPPKRWTSRKARTP